MKRNLSALCGTLIMSALLMSNAWASPIPSWDYTVDGAFISWSTTVGTSGSYGSPAQGITTSPADYKYLAYAIDAGVPVPPGTYAEGYSKLAWGDYIWSGPGPVYSQVPGANKSAIGITANSGTLITDGPASLGMQLFHDNNVILGGSIQLASGVVRAILQLAPSGFPPLPVFSTTLDFKFFETPNGTPTENDVFVLLNPEVTQETFHFYGVDYVFNFGGSFGLIPQAYIDLLGLEPGAVGWITAENALTTHDTFLTITALPTPEPTSIMLMGLGLLGLFGLRRHARS